MAKSKSYGRRKKRSSKRRKPTPRKSPNWFKYDSGKKTGRRSPPISATTRPRGYIAIGNDGNVWKVALTKSGIHRWVLHQQLKQKRRSRRSRSTRRIRHKKHSRKSRKSRSRK